MTRALAFRRIVLPQAWRASLPGMVNEMTFLVKASPAIAVIGVVDLARAAARIAAATYEPLPPFISATIIYAMVVVVMVRAQRQIEKAIVQKYGSPMSRNFEVVLGQWPMYLAGLLNTIWLCAVAAVLSLLLATMLTVVMMHNHVVVRKTAQAAVDGIRCIPFLMLAYLTYYCLPTLGIRLSHWTVGLLTLIIYNTAYFAEILRGAWAHLPHEQEEAGRAFGYTRTNLFVRIIAPQVFLAAAPVLGNQTIILIRTPRSSW